MTARCNLPPLHLRQKVSGRGLRRDPRGTEGYSGIPCSLAGKRFIARNPATTGRYQSASFRYVSGTTMHWSRTGGCPSAIDSFADYLVFGTYGNVLESDTLYDSPLIFRQNAISGGGACTFPSRRLTWGLFGGLHLPPFFLSFILYCMHPAIYRGAECAT